MYQIATYLICWWRFQIHSVFAVNTPLVLVSPTQELTFTFEYHGASLEVKLPNPLDPSTTLAKVSEKLSGRIIPSKSQRWFFFSNGDRLRNLNNVAWPWKVQVAVVRRACLGGYTGLPFRGRRPQKISISIQNTPFFPVCRILGHRFLLIHTLCFNAVGLWVLSGEIHGNSVHVLDVLPW